MDTIDYFTWHCKGMVADTISCCKTISWRDECGQFVEKNITSSGRLTQFCLTNYKRVTIVMSWWRHQMETFSALLTICAGKSPVTGEFRTQRPETRSFDVFLDLRLNKRLSKHWSGWWFEVPSRPLWRHSNGEWKGTCKNSKKKCVVLFLDWQ